jgi:hypothetical protein
VLAALGWNYAPIIEIYGADASGSMPLHTRLRLAFGITHEGDTGSCGWGWVVPGYRMLPESLRTIIRLESSANVGRLRTCGRLYLYDALLERRRHPASPWCVPSGRSSRHQRPWGASDPSPGRGIWPPPIKPTSRMVWCRARKGAW